MSNAARNVELIEALDAAHKFAVLFLAFDGRDRNTKRMDNTLNDLCELAVAVDRQCRAALNGSTLADEEGI